MFCLQLFIWPQAILLLHRLRLIPLDAHEQNWAKDEYEQSITWIEAFDIRPAMLDNLILIIPFSWHVHVFRHRGMHIHFLIR